MGQHDSTSDVSKRGDLFRREAGRTEARGLPTIKVRELTVGEHFLIWRRRQDITQEEAGKMLGISRDDYGELERSKATRTTRELPHIGDLYAYEICFIFRRRSGWTIPMCAEQAGVSRYWYNLMELGKASPERLIEYWTENEG